MFGLSLVRNWTGGGNFPQRDFVGSSSFRDRIAIMISPSILRIEPLHRPGTTSENGTYTTERWSWDFVVDGNSLWSLWKDSDVIGVLGWSDSAIEELSIAKLLGSVVISAVAQ